MTIKRAMFLPGLALCFLCLVKNCFAYDVKPCAQQDSAKSGEYLNLVFCSLNYKNAVDFAEDREVLIQRLKITRPFDEDNHLKFWYINLSPEEEGQVFKLISAFPPP